MHDHSQPCDKETRRQIRKKKKKEKKKRKLEDKNAMMTQENYLRYR